LKLIALISVLVTGGLLIVATSDFPAWGDPEARPNQYLSTHYIQEAEHETAVPNLVTAVLADYRSYDTMFETTVIFTAIIAIIAILRRRKRHTSKDTAAQSLIVQGSSRILLPMIQLFGLYVIAHGHHSPGGGFQGGVILAAGLILISLAFGLPAGLKSMGASRSLALSGTGVMIYAATGLLCMVLGRNFLDYSALQAILPWTTEVTARSFSILIVEIGVAITVTSALYAIYANLSSHGELDEGI